MEERAPSPSSYNLTISATSHYTTIAEAIAQHDSERAQYLTRHMLDLSTDRIQELLKDER